ncbi:MAG TPA: DinB family protein [Vicinamibacterales bacterium]
MVLTKSELIASLQKEVRVLQHLITKIDPAMLDYRPTPKQRSTIELLRYLTNMGPTLVRYAKGQPLDAAAMAQASETANARDFDETVAALAAHADVYVQLLGDMSDEDFRGETAGFDGLPVTRGQFFVNHVIGQCAAYRTQLFLYLKACGRDELNTMNLWVGVDAPIPS